MGKAPFSPSSEHQATRVPRGHARQLTRPSHAPMATSAHPSETATRTLLDSLEAVDNARDLSEALPSIPPGAQSGHRRCTAMHRSTRRCASRPACQSTQPASIQPGSAGRVFRSANPAAATRSDVLTMRRALGVRQMLDFRSDEERREDAAWSLVRSGRQGRRRGKRGGGGQGRAGQACAARPQSRLRWTTHGPASPAPARPPNQKHPPSHLAFLSCADAEQRHDPHVRLCWRGG